MSEIDKKVQEYIKRARGIMPKSLHPRDRETMMNEAKLQVEIAKMIQEQEIMEDLKEIFKK